MIVSRGRQDSVPIGAEDHERDVPHLEHLVRFHLPDQVIVGFDDLSLVWPFDDFHFQLLAAGFDDTVLLDERVVHLGHPTADPLDVLRIRALEWAGSNEQDNR